MPLRSTSQNQEYVWDEMVFYGNYMLRFSSWRKERQKKVYILKSPTSYTSLRSFFFFLSFSIKRVPHRYHHADYRTPNTCNCDSITQWFVFRLLLWFLVIVSHTFSLPLTHFIHSLVHIAQTFMNISEWKKRILMEVLSLQHT